MAETQAAPATGTFCWNELWTRDVAKARSLFGTLFGWTIEEMPMGEQGTYTLFKAGDRMVGGGGQMAGAMWEGVPAHWIGYVAVADTDATTRQAESLGVQVKVPPTEIPNVGRFAIYQHEALGVFAVLGPNKG
jgi:predicted enzyme related to lactoylglutathione lyase